MPINFHLGLAARRFSARALAASLGWLAASGSVFAQEVVEKHCSCHCAYTYQGARHEFLTLSNVRCEPCDDSCCSPLCAPYMRDEIARLRKERQKPIVPGGLPVSERVAQMIVEMETAEPQHTVSLRSPRPSDKTIPEDEGALTFTKFLGGSARSTYDALGLSKAIVDYPGMRYSLKVFSIKDGRAFDPLLKDIIKGIPGINSVSGVAMNAPRISKLLGAGLTAIAVVDVVQTGMKGEVEQSAGKMTSVVVSLALTRSVPQAGVALAGVGLVCKTTMVAIAMANDTTPRGSLWERTERAAKQVAADRANDPPSIKFVDGLLNL